MLTLINWHDAGENTLQRGVHFKKRFPLQSGLGAITYALKIKNRSVRGVPWKCAAGANVSDYYEVNTEPNTFLKNRHS
jgi:hypothetical protein